MQVAFDALELGDAWLDSGPSARWRLNLPLSDISKVAERELEFDAGGVVAIPQQAPHEFATAGPGLRAVGFFATASP